MSIGRIPCRLCNRRAVRGADRIAWNGIHFRGRSVVKFLVSVNRDEDGVWVVECPSIPGCVSQGATRDETLNNIRDAIQICLDVRSEQGLPLTVETHEVEVPV